MQKKKKNHIHVTVILCLVFIPAITFMHVVSASSQDSQAGHVGQISETSAPFDSALKYPFTKYDSRRCGHWRSGSQDYPYFGAPRDGNTRYHAGIDLYPATGAGTPVKAVRDGRVIRNAPFYKRRNGEITYALLIDHKEFTANYAELRKPVFRAGDLVKRNQTIGFISGTKQLHFELYKPGTTNWVSWRGTMPPHLIDPTDMMLGVFRNVP